jgi:predicted DNA-binding transcriptional regulator AlpA
MLIPSIDVRTRCTAGQMRWFACTGSRVGKSRTEIYRDIQAGNFPAPIRIGARAVVWDSTAIETWQEGRISASAPGFPLADRARVGVMPLETKKASPKTGLSD